jgi:hypothetical protein
LSASTTVRGSKWLSDGHASADGHAWPDRVNWRIDDTVDFGREPAA